MTLVFTNGCYDCLHPGHVAFLADARALGDRLIVGLNSDESVRRLKGAGRPVFNVEERRLMLEALRVVDEVRVFHSEEELAELVRAIGPDLLVKGVEYRGRPITGSQFAREVRLLPRRISWSTTRLVQRMQGG